MNNLAVGIEILPASWTGDVVATPVSMENMVDMVSTWGSCIDSNTLDDENFGGKESFDSIDNDRANISVEIVDGSVATITNMEGVGIIAHFDNKNIENQISQMDKDSKGIEGEKCIPKINIGCWINSIGEHRGSTINNNNNNPNKIGSAYRTSVYN